MSKPNCGSGPAVAAVAPWKPQIVLFYITILAGQWGLDRVSDSYRSLGLFGQVRVWLFVALAFSVFLNSDNGRSRLPMAATRRYFRSVVLLHLFLAITAFWTPAATEASEFVSDWGELQNVFLLVGLLLVARTLFASDTLRKSEYLLKVVFVTGLIYGLAGLTGQWGEGDRIAAFGGGPNVFARIVIMGLYADLYFWLKTRDSRWLLAVPLFLTTIVLSGSRGGLVALLASFLLFGFLARREVKHIARGLLILAGVLLCSFFVPFIGQRVLPFWQERFVEQSIEEHYDAGRLGIFAEAGETFVDHPIWGIGLDGFRRTSTLGEYSHNLFLQAACEAGIAGLGLLLWALVEGFRSLFGPATLERRVILTLAAMMFVAQMFSGSYYDARYLWIFLGISWLLREHMQPRGAALSDSVLGSDRPRMVHRLPQAAH